MIHLLYFSSCHQVCATHLKQTCKDRDPAKKSTNPCLAWPSEWWWLWDKRAEEMGRTRAAAKTVVWQHVERDFPKQFGRPENTNRTVLGSRTDGPRWVGGEDNGRRQGWLTLAERWKEQKKQRVKLKLFRKPRLASRSGLWIEPYNQDQFEAVAETTTFLHSWMYSFKLLPCAPISSTCIDYCLLCFSFY